MAFVEVLIQIENGRTFFPKEVPLRLLAGKSYPYNRMGSVVDTIRELAKDNLIIWKDVKHNSFVGKNGENIGVFRIYGNEEYFYTYNPETKENVIYRILKVDTSKPWEIRKTQEWGEFIYTFKKTDNFKIIDKELNYGVSI